MPCTAVKQSYNENSVSGKLTEFFIAICKCIPCDNADNGRNAHDRYGAELLESTVTGQVLRC